MIEIRACTPDDAAAVSTQLSELGNTVPIREATENVQELSKNRVAAGNLLDRSSPVANSLLAASPFAPAAPRADAPRGAAVLRFEPEPTRGSSLAVRGSACRWATDHKRRKVFDNKQDARAVSLPGEVWRGCARP
jgi:hypothetical protein